VSRSRGFSLIEVMAAAAIFAAGLAAIFTTFATASGLFEHQRHTTHGIHLAEAKMEELLLRVSSDSELVAGPTFGPQWFDSRGFAAGPGCPTATSGVPAETAACRYRVTWSSAPLPGLTAASVRVTTVTTAWGERGQEKSVTFSTMRN
jgi:prepilin-type N-terminal cleavage/methylation domain-containing protein